MTDKLQTSLDWATLVFAAVFLFLASNPESLAQESIAPWSLEAQPGLLILKEGSKQIGVFHYQDPSCLRPFFSQVRTVTGTQVTRNFPPLVGVDADDHANMHGGIWLAFGDINGEDFWRNKARIQHKRFTKEPSVNAQGISFASEDELVDSKGKTIGRIEQAYKVSRIELGYLLTWTATLIADSTPLVLGDQEEMGLGVRVATDMTQKNGGSILNSVGGSGAKETWGKTADWADYSKTQDGKRSGVLLIPDSKNLKKSWFHNRDYGLMVANMFGNKSFTGGEASAIRIEPNQSLTIRYGVYWYECGADQTVPIERLRNAMQYNILMP